MKTPKMLFCSLLLCLFISCSNQDEVVIHESISEVTHALNERIIAVKEHSSVLNSISIKISNCGKTRGDVGVPVDPEEVLSNQEVVIYDGLCSYITENDMGGYLKEPESMEFLLKPRQQMDRLYGYFDDSFLDELLCIIDNQADYLVMKQNIEILLLKYQTNKNYDYYLTISSVAIDSFLYWKSQNVNGVIVTRGWLGTLASIVGDDALAAAATIEVAACASLISGGTLAIPSAVSIAGAAGFGSAVSALNRFW